MTPELQVLLEEWHTGREAGGGESVRFASRWRDNVVAGMSARSYAPHVADLGVAVRAQHSPVAVYRTGVSLAVGADDEDDVRIETQAAGSVTAPVLYEKQIHVDGVRAIVSDPRTIEPADLGAVTVERWRPASGGLAHVVEHNGETRSTQPRMVVLMVIALAIEFDQADTTLELRRKAGVLRAARAALREKREARILVGLGTIAVDNQLSQIGNTLAQIVAELSARKIAERLAAGRPVPA